MSTTIEITSNTIDVTPQPTTTEVVLQPLVREVFVEEGDSITVEVQTAPIEVTVQPTVVEVNISPTITEVIVSEGLTAPPVPLLWIDIAGEVEYTGVEGILSAPALEIEPEVETAISLGIVLTCVYKGSPAYRFISTALTANGYPAEDSFYSGFVGTTLSGLLATRGA